MITRLTRAKIKKEYVYEGVKRGALIKKYKLTDKEIDSLIGSRSFRRRKINGIEEKRCINCMTWKPLSEYQKNGTRNGKQLYNSKCKPCKHTIWSNEKILYPERHKRVLEKRREYVKKNRLRLKDKKFEDLTPEQQDQRRARRRKQKRKEVVIKTKLLLKEKRGNII